MRTCAEIKIHHISSANGSISMGVSILDPGLRVLLFFNRAGVYCTENKIVRISRVRGSILAEMFSSGVIKSN